MGAVDQEVEGTQAQIGGILPYEPAQGRGFRSRGRVDREAALRPSRSRASVIQKLRIPGAFGPTASEELVDWFYCTTILTLNRIEGRSQGGFDWRQSGSPVAVSVAAPGK